VPLPRRRIDPRVIVSSAAIYDSGRTPGSRRQKLPWQARALEYYTELGEVRYASQFYARMLSRIRIYPAVLGDDGELEPITSGPPADELDRIQDPGGGRSQIQANYGRLMFITGEGVLFGSQLQTEDERWRFLWIEEIKQDDRTGRTYRVDSSGQEVEEGVSYRMWRPSPQHSDVADSPMRSVQKVCDELILLSSAVEATAVTRLTNGLLLLPQEISPGAAEPIGDEDAENNPFVADLIDHFTGQIENPGAAEARVPPIVEGPFEYLEGIRWMKLHDPQTDYLEKDLRDEAIKRLAIGLDFPPEVLLGMTDANHWTAKQVVHDMWRSHGAPIAEQFCDDISEAYLRPALKEQGYEDWASVVVAYDDADVVIAPDRSEDANTAYDRVGGVSMDGFREMKGIADSLAPNAEEIQLQIALHFKDPALLPEKYLPEGYVRQPKPAQQEPGPEPDPADAQDAEEGPPSPGTRDGSRQESRTASAKVLGAAELALVRCREVAGARIRSYKKSCPECFETVNGKPNTLVASMFGPEGLKEIGAPEPLKLVAGGADAFKTILNDWGFGNNQSAALAEMVEVYAARTLYDEKPSPLSSGFVAHVDRIQEISDAVVNP
jgi:hypothetical protein